MQKVFFKNSRGLRLAAVLDSPPNLKHLPLVLALHGFGATKDESQEWVEILTPLNIATLRLDFSGSGESEGKFENKTITNFLDDAKSALNFACTLPVADKNKLAIVGHSMGATTAILLAASDKRIKTLIASVPAVKVNEVIANLYHSDDFANIDRRGYVELTKNGQRKRLNYSFFEDAKKYDLIQEALKIPYPFLLIGALRDEIVSFEQIKKFTDAVPNSRLLILPNSSHDLENDWHLAKTFIRNWLQSWTRQLGGF